MVTSMNDLEVRLRAALVGHVDPGWVQYRNRPAVRRARWDAHCDGCGGHLTVHCDIEETMPALVGWFRIGHAKHIPHTHGTAPESDWNAVCGCCERRTEWDWADGRPEPSGTGRKCPDCPAHALSV